MTVTAEYWADGPCPVWCDRDHPACRVHMSTGWMCFVVLSTEDPVHVERATENLLSPKELEIYLEQHFREVGPRVVIGQRHQGQPTFKLLPDEASHLGQALVRLATMANDSKPAKCVACEHHPA